jgi:hypothetical protein
MATLPSSLPPIFVISSASLSMILVNFEPAPFDPGFRLPAFGIQLPACPDIWGFQPPAIFHP